MRHHRNPRDTERGAALVEMALVVTLLGYLVFGVISFGILLSYRQNLTQAATEGARAASVELLAADQVSAASNAADAAVSELGLTCAAEDHDGLRCTVSAVVPCPQDSTKACRTVTVRLDNDEHAVVPQLPGLSAVIPRTLTVSSTVIVPGDP